MEKIIIKQRWTFTNAFSIHKRAHVSNESCNNLHMSLSIIHHEQKIPSWYSTLLIYSKSSGAEASSCNISFHHNSELPVMGHIHYLSTEECCFAFIFIKSQISRLAMLSTSTGTLLSLKPTWHTKMCHKDLGATDKHLKLRAIIWLCKN